MTKRDLFLFLFKWKRLLFGLTLFILISSSALIYVQPQSYQASAMLLVERNRAPAMRSSFAPGLESAEVQNTVSAIITTRAVMAQVVDDLHLDHRQGKQSKIAYLMASFKQQLQQWGLINSIDPREKWIDRLLRQVKAEVATQSNIISIGFSHDDPALAQAVINSVTDHFIDLHLKIYSPGGSESLKSQYLSLKADLDQKVEALERFKAQSQGSAIEYRRTEVVKLLGNLKEWQASAIAQAAELRQRYDSGHTELRALQARITQYINSIRETKEELSQLELNASQLRKLQVEVDASEDLYKEYKRRYEETRLDKEGLNRDRINVRVVEYADLPVKPKHSRLFYILLSGIAGMAFSFGIALLLEHFDRRIQDPLSAENILGIPVLASFEKM